MKATPCTLQSGDIEHHGCKHVFFMSAMLNTVVPL
jgi:hypothetical protein